MHRLDEEGVLELVEVLLEQRFPNHRIVVLKSQPLRRQLFDLKAQRFERMLGFSHLSSIPGHEPNGAHGDGLEVPIDGCSVFLKHELHGLSR